MLFSSYIFIFGFLPVALLIFHGLRLAGLDRLSVLALVLLSVFFYGYWNPIYLLLLIPLTLFNFAVASTILSCRAHRPRTARTLMVMGVTANLCVLGYFKYVNFFVDNLNAFSGANLVIATVVLPLSISFFTFQKIAFVVDAYQGRIDRLNFLDFALFVSFFPQLIAGPIVHHSEVFPQFRRPGPVARRAIAMGLTIFAIGLAKKVLLADTAA